MMKLSTIAAAFLGLIMMAAPAAAQSIPAPADFAGLFGTETGDPYSSVLLNQMFGPLFPSATGSDVTTVFSEIIGYFNVIILVVGGLMFFYNVTVGVMQSAHEGQVLGQQWSSLWAPLRVIFAVGLLVPVPSYGGYNLAQVGVAYVVKGSTNIASAVWQQSATLILSGDIPIATSQSQFDPDLIRTLYRNEACMRIVNYQSGIVGNGYTVQYETPTKISTPNGNFNNGAEERFVSQTFVQGNPRPNRGICGSWSTPDLPLYIKRAIDENGEDSVAAQNILDRFANGHSEIVEYVTGELASVTTGAGHPGEPVREDIFSSDIAPEVTTAEIRDIALEANQRMDALNDELRAMAMSAEGHGSVRDALLNRITGGSSCVEGGDETGECYGEGWMGAGSYYTTMARVNAELSSLTSAKASARSPVYLEGLLNGYSQGAIDTKLGGPGSFRQFFGAGSDLPSKDEVFRLYSRYEESFEKSVQPLAALGFHLTPTEVVDANEEAGTDSMNWFSKKIWEKISKPIVRAQEKFLKAFDPGSGGQDPMIGLINIGNALIGVGAALLLASMLAVRVAVVAVPFFSLFFAGGVTLSFVLPLMPFFYWVLGVTGYFLLIVEAIIAVNLWALSHMRMDGDGISGPAGQKGWLMLLALLMTPVLMVFGFLIGMALFRVTSDLVSAGMFYATAGITGTTNPILAMVALVGFSLMIVAAYVFLVERSFSLVSEFPNRVMNWMGEQVNIGGGEDRIRAATAGVAMGTNSLGNNIEKPFTVNPQSGSSAAQRGVRSIARQFGSKAGPGDNG